MNTLASLCEKYALGKIQGNPQAVEGGLLHRMYHVTTDQGDYAIKLLNPDIMKRPRAIQNMMDSERVARHLSHGPDAVPVVAALSGKKGADATPGGTALSVKERKEAALSGDDEPLWFVDMDRDDSPESFRQYALVYPWLEARSMFAPHIGLSHCGKIGRILGQIHHAQLKPEDLGLSPEETARPLYDWQGYQSLARRQSVSWLADYEAMLPDLTRWDRAATEAMKSVASLQVVSHRDLDPKNVLWKDGEPWLIDWEAAGAVNPWQELVEVLYYWCSDQSGALDLSLCRELLQEYTRFMDLRSVDWAPVFAVSFDGMLGWLEYTLKKSLGQEKDEKGEGPAQMKGTYRDLLHRESQTRQLAELCEAMGHRVTADSPL